MQPKRRKHKKEFRGSMHGLAWKGNTITYGDYALQALDRGWVTGRQIEAARIAIVRTTKRKGKIWMKIFPHKPITAKSAEVTRGQGKGDVVGYVAVVKPGRVVMEISGIPEELALESLRLAAQKFPMKMRVVKK